MVYKQALMIDIIRTNSKNKDFIELVDCLNNYLKVVDGDDHDFYHQYNGIEMLNHVVVAYKNKRAIGCGAFKEYKTHSVEIKRMFTKPNFRGIGVAGKILSELENWAKEKGYKNCILETGKRQTQAVSFYKKMNYTIIPNYGQYKDIENSLCFKKYLV